MIKCKYAIISSCVTSADAAAAALLHSLLISLPVFHCHFVALPIFTCVCVCELHCLHFKLNSFKISTPLRVTLALSLFLPLAKICDGIYLLVRCASAVFFSLFALLFSHSCCFLLLLCFCYCFCCWHAFFNYDRAAFVARFVVLVWLSCPLCFSIGIRVYVCVCLCVLSFFL